MEDLGEVEVIFWISGSRQRHKQQERAVRERKEEGDALHCYRNRLVRMVI